MSNWKTNKDTKQHFIPKPKQHVKGVQSNQNPVIQKIHKFLRRNDLELSTKKRKDDYWKKIEGATDKIEKDILDEGVKLVELSGMDQEGKGIVLETIKWIQNEFDLWINNTDFTEHIGRDEEYGYRQELEKIKQSILEGALNWHDKDFGYGEPTRRPQNVAEKLAQQLIEPFEKWKDEELATYAEREADYAKGKQIIKDVINTGFNSAMKNIPK